MAFHTFALASQVFRILCSDPGSSPQPALHMSFTHRRLLPSGGDFLFHDAGMIFKAQTSPRRLNERGRGHLSLSPDHQLPVINFPNPAHAFIKPKLIDLSLLSPKNLRLRLHRIRQYTREFNTHLPLDSPQIRNDQLSNLFRRDRHDSHEPQGPDQEIPTREARH